MAYEVFGEETANNFIYVPDSITAGSRIKCILTAYKEGETDITLETPPVTITERSAMTGSFVHISDFANGPKISVLPTNNIAFAVDDIQSQDGITYQFFIQDPIEAGLLVSGTGFSGTSGDYGSSLPSWEVDGVKVEHKIGRAHV